MSKFNVGDKVRIRKDLIVNKKYSNITFIPSMKNLADENKVHTIIMVDGNNISLKNDLFWWGEDMLEPVETIKEDEKPEMVNNPIHYNSCGDYETIKKMELLFGKEAVLTWARLTAFKYRDRMEFKENKDQDTAKMDWYLKYVEDNE